MFGVFPAASEPATTIATAPSTAMGADIYHRLRHPPTPEGLPAVRTGSFNSRNDGGSGAEPYPASSARRTRVVAAFPSIRSSYSCSTCVSDLVLMPLFPQFLYRPLQLLADRVHAAIGNGRDLRRSQLCREAQRQQLLFLTAQPADGDSQLVQLLRAHRLRLGIADRDGKGLLQVIPGQDAAAAIHIGGHVTGDADQPGMEGDTAILVIVQALPGAQEDVLSEIGGILRRGRVDQQEMVDALYMSPVQLGKRARLGRRHGDELGIAQRLPALDRLLHPTRLRHPRLRTDVALLIQYNERTGKIRHGGWIEGPHPLLPLPCAGEGDSSAGELVMREIRGENWVRFVRKGLVDWLRLGSFRRLHGRHPASCNRAYPDAMRSCQ